MKKSVKLVKESIDESINETIQMEGHNYDIFKIDGVSKIFAGKDGLLGKDGTLISWDMVKKLMKKIGVK